MYKIFVLLFIFVTLLYSSNPKAYATLGDKIYNNVANIKKLTTIGDYYLYVDEINDYLKRVKAAKEEGLLLNENSPVQKKKNYLNRLRELSKENDYYSRMAQTSLEASMENGDSLLFTKIINSGLIDTKIHKKAWILILMLAGFYFLVQYKGAFMTGSGMNIKLFFILLIFSIFNIKKITNKENKCLV